MRHLISATRSHRSTRRRPRAVGQGRWLALVLAMLLALTGLAARAEAAASPWAENEHGRVRLLAATNAVGDGERVALGLEFEMRPGWKIYWRAPGDAGYPPAIDWSGSRNLADAALAWPAPTRFSILGFETIGYHDAVVLPITARPSAAGEALSLRARVDYLTCAEICVPHVVDLALDLPAGAAAPSPEAESIARFRARVPGDGQGVGLALAAVEAVSDGTQTTLRVVARSDGVPFAADADVFVEGPAGVAFGRPRPTLAEDGRLAILTLPVITDGPPATLAGETLTLTLVSGARALETTRAVGALASPPTPVAEAPVAPRPLALVLLTALIGGLILNVMPCVLPVLSLKLLAVVSHGGATRRRVRFGFLASAAGIVSSFWLLALVLIVLKGAGVAIGWGMQFQQPWFLVAMILLLTAFACNLWGWFEVPLPAVIAGLDSRVGQAHGLAGHFLTGALATLLATPCSAPFLGTAIGFALSRGAFDIVLVFTALGLGLALPYLAVAAAPGLATRLPRPGRWMLTLRRVLGLALAATALWLLAVLAGSGDQLTVAIVGGGALAIVALLAAGHRLHRPQRRRAVVAALTVALAAFVLPLVLPSRPAPAEALASRPATGPWVPFEEARIADLVADGKTVLVNVTADWCLTCKANETLVLGREPLKSRLGDENIVAMRADWTRPDPAIAAYLAKFGRYGIPFDAVYGPALPQGRALPEVLTTPVVVEALDRAAANARLSAAGRPR